jgi:hypothetical protein
MNFKNKFSFTYIIININNLIKRAMSSFINNLNILIRHADYFGVPINFQVKDKHKYRSLLGGSIFIFYFIFSVVYIFLNFKNFINREQINSILNEVFLDFAPELDFVNMSLSMAIGLDVGDPTNLAKIYKYLQINANLVEMKKSDGISTKTKYILNLSQCNQSKFEGYELSYEQLGLKNYFCPEFTNTSIKGLYTEELFKYYEFSVSLRSEYLKDFKEARQLFTDYDINFNIYYVDNTFDVYNFEKPIRKFISNKFSSLDWIFIKKTNFDFMRTSFTSDSNVFMKDPEKQELIVSDFSYEYFKYTSEDRMILKLKDYNTFSKVYIRSLNKERVIKRVYSKITEYLANMSSILSSILLILYVIMTYLNYLKAHQYIMKNILKFKENLNLNNDKSLIYLKSKFLNKTCNLVESKISFFNNITYF